MERNKRLFSVGDKARYVLREVISPPIAELSHTISQLPMADSLTSEGVIFVDRMLQYPWWNKYAKSERAAAKIGKWIKKTR